MAEVKPWGLHAIVDAADCDPALIRDPANISAFAKELVQRIDMVAFGEPQVIHFGEDDKQGYTLVQLIETSNICAHFVEETNDFYLDVFSCKSFDPVTVLEVAFKYFKFGQYRIAVVERSARGSQSSDADGVNVPPTEFA